MIKYDYQLKRTARRTVSVCIKDDNSITVNAPLRMPIREIEKFLLAKSKWIEEHLKRNELNGAFLSDVISYKNVLIEGKALPLKLCDCNQLTDEEVKVKSVKNLKRLLIDNFGDRFLKMFGEIRDENDLKCGMVNFKDYKSKWGCCDREGNIIFNYKLLMLPQNIWRYVAVHELCHTVYMDHSKSFYALVGRIMPDYKAVRRQLKSYSRITRLY